LIFNIFVYYANGCLLVLLLVIVINYYLLLLFVLLVGLCVGCVLALRMVPPIHPTGS